MENRNSAILLQYMKLVRFPLTRNRPTWFFSPILPQYSPLKTQIIFVTNLIMELLELMSLSADLFHSFEAFWTPHTLKIAYSDSQSAVGKGKKFITAKEDSKCHRTALDDVSYVPKIQKINIFSSFGSRQKPNESLPIQCRNLLSSTQSHN